MFKFILFAGFTISLLSTAISFGQDQSRTEDSSAVHAVLNDSTAVKKAGKPPVPKLTFHENLLNTPTDQLKGLYKSHRRKAIIGTVWGSVGAAFYRSAYCMIDKIRSVKYSERSLLLDHLSEAGFWQRYS